MHAEETFADDDGLHLETGHDRVVDLYFDRRRIWSVDLQSGRRDPDGVVHVAWPERMRRRLDGHAHLEVRDNLSKETLADGAVSFGSKDEPLDFTDRHGRPLTLNKWGRFTHTFDTTPREVVEGYLDDVEAVLALLRDECGVPAFISFGTLLGAVREGSLIGHDVDVDVGYLSAYSDPVDVARESMRIEAAVKKRGWRVVRQTGGFLALFFPQRDGSSRNLDIFTAFFVGDMLYQVNDIGVRARRSDVLPLGTVDFEGRPMPAPAHPEVFLEAAYGPGWRVPDPGFSFDTPRHVRRRLVGWLGGLRRERDWWARRYETPVPRAQRRASSFARWVDEREPEGQVVDVGCGRGNDTTYFAQAGRSVVGVDFVPAAVQMSRRRARGASGEAQLVNCNLYRVDETLRLAARLAHEDVRRTVYARLLFEDLAASGRDLFWRFCSMVLRRRGGRCYVETISGGSRPPSARLARERPASPEALVAEAVGRGARLVHREDLTEAPAPGLPPAQLTRLVLEW